MAIRRVPRTKRKKSQAAQRALRRHSLFETLEARQVMDHAHAIYAPGTPREYMDQFPDFHTGIPSGASGFQAADANRWSATATNGAGLGQGDPTTLTWSIAPDGTSDGTAGSNLIARFDALYGTAPGPVANRPWFPLFRQAIDSWSVSSGIDYVYEPNDDGVTLGGANQGQLGVRGDVRIMGRNIDGNSGILAFNFFPNNGDMVIDTNDNTFNDTSNNSLILRNVLAHETGHGLGFNHVEPINQTKLMEPILATAFDGPQHDDILAANRLYGDRNEPNDTSAAATNVGNIRLQTAVSVSNVSIDDNSDTDFYRFQVGRPGIVDVRLSPFGFSYLQGPQGGAPAPFDSTSLSDLSLTLIASNGATVLATANAAGVGSDEFIRSVRLDSPGEYYLRVNGAADAVQLYSLSIGVGILPTGPKLISVQPNDGELLDPDGGGCTTLVDSNCLSVAPREITLRFDGSQSLDPTTFGGIRLTGSVDGIFGNGNDQIIDAPRFVISKTFDGSPRIVAIRFADPLPDDRYRIEVFGYDDPSTGIVGLRNTTRDLFIASDPNATGVDRKDTIDFEINTGAQITSIVPQPVTRVQNISFLGIPVGGSFRLSFRDDTQVGRPLETTSDLPFNASAAQIQSALVALNSIDVGDVTVTGTGPWQIAFSGRFAGEQLPRLLADNGTVQGATVQVSTTLRQERNQIVVYFNDDDLRDDPTSAENPNFYQLIFTNDTARNTGGQNAIREDDQNVHLPMTVAYYPEKDKAVLTFANDINLLSGAGTYRLRIGNQEKTPAAPVELTVLNDPRSSFVTALDLSGLGFNFGLDASGRAKSVIVSSTIDPLPYNLNFPGDVKEPGHRDTPVDQHYEGIFGADEAQGITEAFYNFRSDYGVDPFGNPLLNAITEAQKQRTREIFELISSYTGIRFIETADQGITVVTGDLRAVDPAASSGPLGYEAIAESSLGLNGRAIMSAGRNWYDGYGEDEVATNSNWFEVAFATIQLLLGHGFPNELAPNTIAGSLEDRFTIQSPATDLLSPTVLAGEPVYPGDHDITHGQHLNRPESRDIDLYRFSLAESGLFSAEIVAERLDGASLLDSVLRLYRERLVNGQPVRELISQNNDYFSSDSYVELQLESGTYFIGVSASGNDQYDPHVEDSGLNGTSQGKYELRLNFRPQVNVTIVDTAGQSLDGDADGLPGGVFDYWFRAQDAAHTRFVDKAAAVGGTGTAAAPFRSLPTALAAAQPGDIVRVVGNGGADGDLATQFDNLAFEIGFGGPLNTPLSDGPTMEVPRGVTVMVDAGAEFKLRQARIGVGSSTAAVDRSAGALQVLGIPNETVVFTSYNDESVGLDTNPVPTTPLVGDWGGIVFRDDVDKSQGRFTYDRQGIFLNHVNHADMKYGGGNVFIDGVLQIVNPIHVFESRPTITHNDISLSADAAISADPNSFEESNFNAPVYQLSGAFTSDYQRIGPDVHGNRLTNNSNNGLFIRVTTPAGTQTVPLTVAGRFNDTDVVHIISENLIVEGTPGGPVSDERRPLVNLIAFDKLSGGTLAAGTYQYRITFVDINGSEGPPSTNSGSVSITGGPGQGAVRLRNLPTAPTGYVGRRLYRSSGGAYELVASLDVQTTTFVDNGTTLGGNLVTPNPIGINLSAAPGGTLANGTYNYQITFVDSIGQEGVPSDGTSNVLVSVGANRSVQLNGLPTLAGYRRAIYRSSPTGVGPYQLVTTLNDTATSFVDTGSVFSPLTLLGRTAVDRARLDARLAIDPNIIVKLEGSRIDATMGAQIIAEGHEGQEIIFTSRRDDRYGGSGSFDTNNDGVGFGAAVPNPGDWGGIVAGPLGTLSIDHALITYAGGVNKIEGTFAGFNAIEIHQADARITHSVLENNSSGLGGQSERTRNGRGFNDASAIFIRGAQPIIVDNVIRNNTDQNPNTQLAAISINVNALNHERVEDFGRSRGEIERLTGKADNQGPFFLENRLGGNEINGLNVRGGVLTTQSVWDDTDVVHVVRSEIVTPDFHTYGGLRLESSSSESLVIKLSGPRAGFTATGRPLDIDDRIGGAIQILGQPGFPVVLTALNDSTVGAGFQPNGLPQTQTVSQGTPNPGEWRSIRLDQYSHDRNVDVVLELEPADTTAPGPNATPQTAQFLGALAPHEKGGDDNLRLGIELHGFLTEPADVDVFSFRGTGGSEVWFDIDRTTVALDTVVELIDSTGALIARSDDYVTEQAGNGPVVPNPQSQAFSLNKSPFISNDRWTTNPKDAGFRAVLTGTPGVTGVYHVRVRSSSPNLDAGLSGGQTRGGYQLQIRLRELDEIPGSIVRFADIRFATNGIELLGMPGHSPLLGEAVEAEVGFGANDGRGTAEDLGNVLNADRGAVSIAGRIDPASEIRVATASTPFNPGLFGRTTRDDDWYRFSADFDNFEHPINNFVSTVFDLDYSDGIGRGDLSLAVYDTLGRLILVGRDSSVADDLPAPRQGIDIDDLSRGSIGVFDPLIGPVYLPETDTLNDRYSVVVTSTARIPQELEQFSRENPVNPLVRLEPVNSVARIAEDRVGFSGGSQVADAFSLPVLFDNTSPVPFNLGDVTLFVSQAQGLVGNDRSSLHTVNPFTGTRVTTAGSINPQLGDIAMRADGEIFSFSTGPATGQANDANVGNYLQIDSGTAATNSPGDDTVETYINDPANPGNAIRSNVNNVGHGVRYTGITFTGTANEAGFAIGNRGDADSETNPSNTIGPQFSQNILYNFNILSGVALNPGGGNDKTGAALLSGAGTQKIERGRVLTYTEIRPQNVEANDVFTITINGQSISYTAVAPLVQDVVGGLASAWQAASATIPEFAAFEVSNSNPGNNQVLNIRLSDPSGANFTINPSTTNGGLTPNQSISVNGFGPGGIVTGLTNLFGQLYAVTDRGGLFTVNTFGGGGFGQTIPSLGTYVRSSAQDLLTGANGSAVAFAGVTAGPNSPENGLYAQTLFGIDTTGNLYAFDTGGRLQPVFSDSRTSVPTGIVNSTGLAFSTLDRNLWTTTGHRGSDPGHGIYNTFDGSRVGDLTGGTSFYFGNTFTGDGNRLNGAFNALVRDYNYPGGAHGILESNPFSLEGYNSADQPVLYFNYFLDTEDTDYDPNQNPINFMRDSFRVFVVEENGQSTLVGTNDSFIDDGLLDDEFDFGQGDSICSFPSSAFVGQPFRTTPCVQQFFDDTGGWRQARIPLDRFAGQEHLRLRFEFATAGSRDVGDPLTTGSELKAIPGQDLRDGQTLQIDSELFEFESGYTIVAPPGAGIDVGDAISLNGRTFTFISTGTPTASQIVFNPSQSPAEIARNIAARLSAAGIAAHVNGDRVNVPTSSELALSGLPANVREGAPGTATGYPIFVNETMSRDNVALAIAQALADVFGTTVAPVTSGSALPNLEVEPNDTLATAQNANAFAWTLSSNPNIGDFFTNTSTTIPHASVFGTGDGSFDYYSFTVSNAGDRGIFDIDNSAPGFDTELFLFDAAGNFLAGNDDTFFTGAGAGGSTTTNDSFFQFTFPAPGTYIIGVGEFNSTGGPGGITGNTLDPGDNYTLHISVTNHPVSGGGGFVSPGSGGLDAPNAAIFGPDGNLYVSSSGTNEVLVYDGTTGAFQSAFVTAGDGGLASPNGMVFGSDGNLYVVSQANNRILRYQGPLGLTPGAFIDVFSSGPALISPRAIVLDPTNGSFLVTSEISATTSSIVRIQGPGSPTPGAISTLVTAGTGGLNDPRGLAIGPDGNLYVSDEGTNSVLRFSRTTGQFLGVFATNSLNDPQGIGFGSDGALYVAEGTTGSILRFSGQNGGLLSVIANGGVAGPSGLAFRSGGTGSIVVASRTNDQVLQFNFALIGQGDPDNVKTNKETVNVVNHTITNPGPLGFENSLAGDSFGAYSISGPPQSTRYPGSLRGMNNANEGVHIDDIIIGFAERGEMVTRPVNDNSANNTFVDNWELLNRELPLEHEAILAGEYQLEIRRGAEYGIWTPNGGDVVLPTRNLDTNDRLSSNVQIRAFPGADISDGQTFVVSDGVRSFVFEFDSLDLDPADPDVGVPPGNVRLPYRSSFTANQIAELIRDTINVQRAQNNLNVTASLLDRDEIGTLSTNNVVSLAGSPVITATSRFGILGSASPGDTFASDHVFTFINDSANELITSIRINLPNGFAYDPFPAPQGSGPIVSALSDTVGETFQIPLAISSQLPINFSSFGPGKSFVFGIDVDILGSPGATVDGASLDGTTVDVTFSNGVTTRTITTRFDALGNGSVLNSGNVVVELTDEISDSNIVREQGQVLISSNVIRNSSQFGVAVDAGQRTRPGLAAQAGVLPHSGPARYFDDLNTDRFAPGAVISNNLIFGSGQGGILFSGDPNLVTPGPVSFGRVINNTLYGKRTGDVGIQVEQNSSPTLLNNIVSNFGTGIRVDASSGSTVIGTTLYQGIPSGQESIGPAGLGSFSVVEAASPFVNAAGSNFYLRSGTRAIDSSLDSLDDRADFANRIRGPLGIEPSPIIAPDRDVLGQLRADDPRVNPPAGLGANVFKDRGAIDRSDFTGLTAELLDPLDNDSLGNDLDPNPTVVKLASGDLRRIEILLVDGEGTGPDNSSLTSDSLTITQNGELLIDGIDYTFGYNATSHIIRLTPLSGIWTPGATYVITLNNRDRIVIDAPSGDNIADGTQISIQNSSGLTRVYEFESGYSIRVPQTLRMQVPVAGGNTGGIEDGQRFRVTRGGTTANFEFDTDNSVTAGHIPITLTTSDSQDQVADKIVAALNAANLGLSPRNLGGGEVHLGSRGNHTLDVAASRLTQSGQPDGVVDGESFVVSNGNTTVIYEFDDNNVTGGQNVPLRAPPGRTIAGMTHTEIADLIAGEIDANTSLGLPNTQHLANGLINFGGTANHTISTGNSHLILSGAPGVASGAVPILYLPFAGFGVQQVAGAIINAINGAAQTGISASLRGGGTIFVDGATAITGITNFFLPSIRDIAGNNLQASQATGATQFTISLPGTELDFGDAPDPIYSTTAVSNGARHVLLPIGNIYLGASVDAEADGQPNATATGDGSDEDGVQFGFFRSVGLAEQFVSNIFTPGFATNLTVTASDTGFLDAWVDFNQDGDWNDPEEQIVRSVLLSAGRTPSLLQPGDVSPLRAFTPANAQLGLTTARFRFSPLGGLFPTGISVGGEVEDYQVRVISNDPPTINNAALTSINGNLAANHSLEDDPDRVINLAGLFSDADVSNGNGDVITLSVSGVSQPNAIAPSIAGNNLTIDFLPNKNDSGSPIVITVRATDHGGRFVDAAVTLPVDAVNDAPAITLPASLSVVEDEARTITGLIIDDVDAEEATGNKQIVTTLEVDHGRLNLRTDVVNGLLPGNVTGNGTGTVVVTATPTAIKATLAASGGLVYTPAPDYNGPDELTITANDQGRFGLGGPLTTGPVSLPFTVAAVNDAPVWTTPASLGAIEDIRATFSNIRLSDVDSGSNAIRVSMSVTNGTLSFASTTGLTFSAGNGTNNTSMTFTGTVANIDAALGTLSFLGSPNVNGVATLTLTVDDLGFTGVGGPKTDSRNVNIFIAAVNDAPQFVLVGGDQTVNEDAGVRNVAGFATGIQRGPLTAVDETSQTLTFDLSLASTEGNLAFTVLTINPANGTLTYQAEADTNGKAVVDVRLRDDGGTANGGVDTSTSARFTITVNAINDAPQFTRGPNIQINEDAGLQQLISWATDIRKGPIPATDEDSQSLSFNVALLPPASGNLQFTVAPQIDPATGNLSFETAPDTNGVAIFRITLSDNGSGVAPNVNTSASQTFTISVNAVNDAPLFNGGPDIVLNEDAGAQLVNGWATGIQRGPLTATDEAGQLVSFQTSIVSTTGNLSFTSTPAVNALSGNLSFVPAPNTNGTATVRVVLVDSGSNLSPNVNNSAPHTLTITVNALNDAPVINVPGPRIVSEDADLRLPPISVNDLDAVEGAGNIQLVLRAANGTLRLNPNVPNGLVAGDITNNGTNAVVVVSTPARINATLAGLDGLTYRGNLHFNGNEVLTFSADDLGNTGAPGARTGSATMDISVTPVNDPPALINPVVDYTVQEDAARTVIDLVPSVFDDPDRVTNGDSLSFTVVSNSNPSLITPTISIVGANTMLLVDYRPDQNGIATLVIRVRDVVGEVASDTFNVTVNAVNDAPAVIRPIADRVIDEDDLNSNVDLGPVFVDVDVTTNADVMTILSPPTNGNPTVVSASIAGNALTLDPLDDQNGLAEIVVTARDAAGLAASDTFLVTVREINDAPITSPDIQTIDEDIPLTFSSALLRVNDLPGPANESGQTLTISAVSASSTNGGTVTLSNGTVTYTPAANFNGVDTFTYTVIDNGTSRGVADPKSSVGTVTVTVVDVNDAPIAGNDTSFGSEDSPLTINASILSSNDQAGPADEVQRGQNVLVTAVSPLSTQGGTVIFDGVQLRYTPAPNFNGVDTFTYTVTDNGTSNGNADSKSTFGTVTVNVAAVNDNPIALSDSRATPEDTTLAIPGSSLAANDLPGPANEAGQSLIVVAAATASAEGGNVVFNLAIGQISYTPPANFNGLDTITYTVQDNGLSNGAADPRTAVGTVTITVNAVNDVPTPVNDTLNAVEDNSLTFDSASLTINDTRGPANESSQTLTVSSVSASSQNGGTVTLDSGSGQIVYTPALNFNGTDRFTYIVSDNGTTNGNPDSQSATGTVTISVASQNDPPVPGPDSRTIAEDGTTAFNSAVLLTNDSRGPADENSQTLTVTSVSANSGQGGSATLVGGTISYTPPLNFSGIDTLIYFATDNGQSNGSADPKTGAGTISFTITPVNDPPTAVNDTTSTTEDSPFSFAPAELTTNDLAGPADEFSQVISLTGVATTSVRGGKIILDGATGRYTYTPPTDFNGTDTFTYSIRDNGKTNGVDDPRTAQGTVTISVTPANDPPIAASDTYSTNEDSVLRVAGRGVLANDTDIDIPAQPLIVTFFTNRSATGASVTVNGDGTFEYDPAGVPEIRALRPGQILKDTFTYRLTDGIAESAEATVTINVEGLNDAPVAVDDLRYSTVEDRRLVVPAVSGVQSNDSDPDTDSASLRFLRVAGPSNGTLQLNLDGSFDYLPNPNFVGVDSFTYRANDGLANSNVATVAITVTAENDPPLATSDNYSARANITLVVPAGDGVLKNDADPEGSSLTAQLSSNPSNGRVTLNADGSFSYQPNAGFSGNDSFTYRAADAQGALSVATSVTISVDRNAPWQNGRNRLDVNNDGSVSPIDALAVVNRLNDVGAGPLPAPGPGGPPPFYDVNGDNQITSLDALLVINFLNGLGSGEGEGQIAAASTSSGLVLPDYQLSSLDTGLTTAHELADRLVQLVRGSVADPNQPQSRQAQSESSVTEVDNVDLDDLFTDLHDDLERRNGRQHSADEAICDLFGE